MKIKKKHLKEINKIGDIITTLAQVQDAVYEKLSKLGFSERAKEFLFDYVYNSYLEHESFEQYLKEFKLDSDFKVYK